MKSSEICQLAINIVAGNYGTVQYRLGNSLYYAEDLRWCNLSWGGPSGYYSDAWHADCIGFVRAVLCGWNADKNAYGGGANIDPDNPSAYGCKWFNERQFLDSCSSISNNFSALNIPCVLLYKQGHVGLYVGEYQIGGKTYNTCECCFGLKYGGSPTWTATDGNRRADKDAGATDSYWEYWGVFNLNGTDYGITEYDGGASGSTGFGSELSEDEVNFYWDTVYEQPWLTYSYLENLANLLFGMDADYFRCFAGYVYGENPTYFDNYMLYLDSCITVNMFMGWGYTTPDALAAAYGAVDQSGYYSKQNMMSRGTNLENDTTSVGGKRSLAGIYLAMMNPNQYVTECVGYPVYNPRPPAWRIIYTQYNLMPQNIEQWALKSAYEDKTYDITGTGVRGGIGPNFRKRTLPIWMLTRRPFYNSRHSMSRYRFKLY